MALVKATFNSALETQFKLVLQPVFEYLFITLPNLNALPIVTKDKGGNDIQIRQPAIDGATANAKEWSDRLSTGLAQSVSDQVDAYIKTAIVIVATGIPVTTAGTAAAQTGATTAPGIGDPIIGTGGLS